MNAPRKGTRLPKTNKRRGEVKKDLAPAKQTGTLQDRLAAQLPDVSRDLVDDQVRRLAALAEEVRRLRTAAGKRGVTVPHEQLEGIKAEGYLRVQAIKGALGNRDELNDIGVDVLEMGISECLEKPKRA